MRIAVIGGGLFGSTAAIYAARAGHDVHLFEAKNGLMLGATAGTYARLHRGYHYPRDPATGRESRRAEASFRDEYGFAVVDGGQQFYVVPPDSPVSGEQFRSFLDNEDLQFTEDRHVFNVREPRVNLSLLSALVRLKVIAANVKVHLGERAPKGLRQEFDRIVVATYSGLNETLWELGHVPAEYRFQVVERPIVFLPERFRSTSVVVIDGPFGCLDPLDDTPLHMLGHVVHTVHAQNTGIRPEIPAELASSIDQGIISTPPVTNFRKVVDDLAKYIPGVSEAVHIGSSFVVRAVLAHKESTDARPTIVTKHGDQVISVLSGKLGTACRAAQEIVDMIENKKALAA
jgi:hypothetical protein